MGHTFNHDVYHFVITECDKRKRDQSMGSNLSFDYPPFLFEEIRYSDHTIVSHSRVRHDMRGMAGVRMHSLPGKCRRPRHR